MERWSSQWGKPQKCVHVRKSISVYTCTCKNTTFCTCIDANLSSLPVYDSQCMNTNTSSLHFRFLNKMFCLSSLEAVMQFVHNPRAYLLPPQPRNPCKVCIIGPPTSGKTTLAGQLADYYKATVSRSLKPYSNVGNVQCMYIHVHTQHMYMYMYTLYFSMLSNPIIFCTPWNIYTTLHKSCFTRTCIYVHVHFDCILTYVHVTCTCTCTCMYLYTLLHTCTCTYMYMYMCYYVHVSTCIFKNTLYSVHTCTYIYIRVCACTCAFVYVHVRAHVYAQAGSGHGGVSGAPGTDG